MCSSPLSLLHTAVFDTSFRASNALVFCISDDAGAVPSMEQKELLFRSIATLLSKNGLSASANLLIQEPNIKVCTF